MSEVQKSEVNIFEKVKADAARYVEEKKKNNFEDFAYNLVWLGDGITKFRLYLDHKDQTVARSILRHKINGVNIPCLGEGCLICKAYHQVDDMGYGHAYEFAAKERVLSYGVIYDADWMDKSQKETLLNKTVLLMYDWKVKREISTKLGELTTEKISELLDHSVAFPVFSLNYKGGKGGNVSLGFDLTLAKMIPLPEDYDPLSKCYMAADLIPTTEVLTKAISYMMDTAKKAISTKIVDPHVQVGNAEGPKTQVTDINKECFGKHVPSPQCIFCKIESECKKMIKAEPF